MSDDRKKPGVAFWATVSLVVMVLYVLSFGPACWLNCRNGWIGRDTLSIAYRPIIRLAAGDRTTMTGTIILWWASLGADGDTIAYVWDNDHIEWGNERGW